MIICLLVKNKNLIPNLGNKKNTNSALFKFKVTMKKKNSFLKPDIGRNTQLQ